MKKIADEGSLLRIQIEWEHCSVFTPSRAKEVQFEIRNQTGEDFSMNEKRPSRRSGRTRRRTFPGWAKRQ